MPASIVKSFAQKTGKSTKEVERLWNKAKEAAKENGRSEDSEDFYPYVTGILKKMLKVNEMNESTLIARLEKFAGQKIKPGRNTIKGFPVDIEDNPDGDYIEMSAVDLDASKSLTKLLRKAGFKAKATKTEILISEGTTKSTKIFKEFVNDHF